MTDFGSSGLTDVLGIEPDALLSGLAEAITVQSASGELIYANPAAAELLGFGSPEELLNATPEEIRSHFDVRDASGQPVSVEDLPGRRALRGGEAEPLVLRVRNLQAGGGERWRSVTAFLVRDSSGQVVAAVEVFEDITDRKHSEARLRAQYEVTKVLSETTSLEDAAPRIIEAVCRSLDWDLGTIWRVDETAGLLRFVEAWSGPGIEATAFVDLSRQMTFARGATLPGRVWATCAPVWIRDVRTEPKFNRAAVASHGIRSAFAFPIIRADDVVGVIEVFARDLRDPDDDLLEMLSAVGAQVGVFIDRLQGEEDRRFLVRVTDVLAQSLEYERTMGEVAGLAIPRLADVCLVYMQEDDGSIRRVAIRQSRAIRRKLGPRLRRDFPLDPNAREGIPKVLRTGRSELHPDADPDLLAMDVLDPEGLAAFVRPLGVRSWMCVPLSARGRTFGAISFIGAGSGRRFDHADLALAEELGRRAALAMDNAHLYRQVEVANERLAYLAEVSRSLSASLNFRRTLAKVARLTVPRLADWCVVDTLGDDGSIELLAVSHTDPGKVRLARRLRRRYPIDPDAPRGVPRVLRTGRSELFPEISDELLLESARDAEHLELLRELQLRSVMIVPLSARGKILGAVTMVSAESGRTYDAEDLRLAEEVAARAAVAVDNARLYEERSSVARTLQRSLLPPDLPAPPGIEVAASYRPAGVDDDIGGDFYDVFPRGEGEWALVIGDVCGKGIGAASLTGLVRHTIRATAMQGLPPEEILETLNQVIRADRSDAGFCTAVVGFLRPENGSGELTLVCGGHPLPFLVRPDGTVEPVGRPGTLVGVMTDIDSPTQTIRLVPGDAVVLYTDGATDQRSNGKLFGEARLRRALKGSGTRDARSIVERIEQAIDAFTTEPPRDDMALLAIRLSPDQGVGSPSRAAG